MRGVAFILLTVLLILFLSPAAAITPLPPPPDPARLQAARSFVSTLPIVDALTGSFSAYVPVRAELERALLERAATMDPRSREGGTGAFVSNAIKTDIDRRLPAILPSATETMAVAYARQFNVEELNAAARFFGSREGRAMGLRLVVTDPVVTEALRTLLYRAIEPELDSIIAAAVTGERLRTRVNEAR